MGKRCIGCHTTGIRALFQDPAGEWAYRPYPAVLVNPDRAEQYPDYDVDGIPDIVNVGCEACHGPGSLHILGGGDPDEGFYMWSFERVDGFGNLAVEKWEDDDRFYVFVGDYLEPEHVRVLRSGD